MNNAQQFSGDEQTKLAELMSKLPDELRPVAEQYAPWLLSLTYDELWNWVHLLVSGHERRAYALVVEAMQGTELEEEMAGLVSQWADANYQQSQRLDVSAQATEAVLSALLRIALAMFGIGFIPL
jgi:hypothetical protein